MAPSALFSALSITGIPLACARTRIDILVSVEVKGIGLANGTSGGPKTARVVPDHQLAPTVFSVSMQKLLGSAGSATISEELPPKSIKP